MIEGLKVIVRGDELVRLCMDNVVRLNAKATKYQERIDTLIGVEFEESKSTDPVKEMEKKRDNLRAEADELTFTAAHLDLAQAYLLARDDLFRLGVVASRY